MPSKSRSPFWNRLSPQKFTGETSLAALPPSTTVRAPCGWQKPSANSHSWPLAKLLLGHAIGPVVPSVVAPLQTPVLGLHGPSPRSGWPFARPSVPPTQVSKSFLSTTKPGALSGSLLVSEAHVSAWPISSCISTPPSRAAQGTWFCCLAVSYSAWKVCRVPWQVLKSVFAKPLAWLATMKPLWCVVRSVTFVVNPAVGSLICTFNTSPELKVSVSPLGVRVWMFAFCGLGGPAGTAVALRNARVIG